ncbi:MAG TPA: hypothetical protein VH561_05185 [Micromonosporaceae bacterium]|jgi:hypothetical protein
MTDQLVPRTLARLRRTDPAAARRAERALGELLGDGGLADLTQHGLQTYLWYTLASGHEPQLTAAALQSFFDLSQMHRYAAVAGSTQTKEVLRAYDEQGTTAGARAAARAMDASGVLPPDLPELEWGELMGPVETDAYQRIAVTLELALAAGELRPGGRGWRMAQQRLARHQLTLPRPEGQLLDRVRAERLATWADVGGAHRRGLADAVLADLLVQPAPPPDLNERIAPVQWLLELATGRPGDEPGIPLTVTGNLARRVVQEASERFAWWELSDRPPRSESDIWQLAEIRLLMQRAGLLRRSGRTLVLGTRGRALLGDPLAQWQWAMTTLIDEGDFESAAQEAGLMLLLSSGGMVDARDLIKEVAEVLGSSGWRDTGDGTPPEELDVSRAVWDLLRRCELWALVGEERGPSFTTRVRLSDAGIRAAHTALRLLALRPRLESP